MRRMLATVMFFALIAALVGYAYTLSGAPATPPSRDADIKGAITSVEPMTGGDVVGAILIEDNPADKSGSAKAYVRVTKNTRLVAAEKSTIMSGQGDLTPMGFSDLQEGMSAQAWFTGPVAESYPVQATAEFIVILR